MLASETKSGAPLSSPGFGRNPLDALFIVVVGLGDCRVGLVGTGRTGALVFEIDLCRGVESLL